MSNKDTVINVQFNKSTVPDGNKEDVIKTLEELLARVQDPNDTEMFECQKLIVFTAKITDEDPNDIDITVNHTGLRFTEMLGYIPVINAILLSKMGL